MILAMHDIILIGRKSFMVVGQAFLLIGRILLVFQALGKVDFVMHELIRNVRKGRITGIRILMKFSGIKSKPAALLLILRIAFSTSKGVTLENEKPSKSI
jgi:hypothetical protein